MQTRTAEPRWLLAVCALTGLLVLAGGYWLMTHGEPSESRRVPDFLQLYTGARLATSPDLYAPEANHRIELEALGRHSDSVVYSRPPFYALLLRPLAALPFPTALLLFQLLGLACCAASVWLLAERYPPVVVLAAFSIPMLICFRLGQDTPLVLLAFTVFFHLLERGRGFRAGLVLALCLIKFHLFPMTALALLLRRETAALRGACAGAAGLLALSFAAQDADWPARYWTLLRQPSLHPTLDLMPNLHAVAGTLLGGRPGAEAILCLVAALAFAAAVLRGLGRAESHGLALVAGLLLSYHAYPQDTLLLLPAAALWGGAGSSGLTRGVIVAAATPVPVLLLIAAGPPWNLVLPLMLLAALLWAARGHTAAERAAQLAG